MVYGEVADILEVLETICNINGYKLKDILKNKKRKLMMVLMIR
ncbi:hypothetical protein RAMDARK_0368 [Rickettsia amblyommatis str. Darkwater]|uniref:Ribosome recycling factor n=1 Tax=Rickettsia amblyommatis (strain GAT-30V) TaxID=1105111 RepID=H8K489_RICAG|nr:ribosome recycling factor [Rickettsia amblyommatis str. GAT-30V]KJV97557.1 hypothetical protein RAMDARK_0368 [Rickettsia amblyommatis str. Darkwater]